MVKKFHEAEKLHNEYKNYFGGKYSASRSPTNSSKISVKKIKDMWNAMILSKQRIIILCIFCFFLSMFVLNKTKPKFILEKKEWNKSDHRIDIYSICWYSIIFGLVLTLILSIIAFNIPKLKEMLFKESCTNMCSL